MTANIILGAVGEGAMGFAQRPVLRKWITRWLWLLWRARLTLADASMLIDPHNPIYELLLQLAPDELSRNQMESLLGMRAAELESEIGSARNRIANVLEHPAADILLGRRQNTLDFRSFYESGQSLILDLDRGEILSEEVQRLVCNAILNQFLAVVLSTPEASRKRWLCMIDELPVFNESCGPLLEKMCTEIRKYKTSFVFLHQGGSRFTNRTDNEFLKTILDMCRVKILFRHNVDAEFFGKLIALAAYGPPRIKHVQTSIQQLTIGHEIVELMDRGEGASEMDGSTETEGTTDTDTNSNGVSDTLTKAVQNIDSRTQAVGSTKGTSAAHGISRAKAKQHTTTTTTNVTRKQTLVPKLETRKVATSIQFHSKEEIEWAAAAIVKGLHTGEAVVMVDGTGIWRTQTPEATEPFSHAPMYGAQVMEKWRDKILRRPEFSSPEAIQKERQEFRAKLLSELRRISLERNSGGSFPYLSDQNDGKIELNDDNQDDDPNVSL